MEKVEIKESRKYWLLDISAEEVLARASLDSNYREHAMEHGGGRYILMEDDGALFSLMLKRAVNDLWLKLARMSKGVTGGLKYTDDKAMLRLEVSDNYEDNLLFTLGGYVDDFVCSDTLRQWYERNGLQDESVKCMAQEAKALENIRSVVHFRKKAVKRPVNPVL